MSEMSQVIEKLERLLNGNSSVLVDESDASPVQVADGVPQIVDGLVCTETFAGSPSFDLSDGASSRFICPLDMVVGDEIDLHNMRFDTDLDIVITGAGTAGMIRIMYRNQ